MLRARNNLLLPTTVRFPLQKPNLIAGTSVGAKPDLFLMTNSLAITDFVGSKELQTLLEVLGSSPRVNRGMHKR